MVQPSLGVQRYGTVTAQTAFASPHRTGEALLPQGAVNQSPLNDYRTIVEAKLKPALGKLRLPQLDPVTLDRFYGRLRRRPQRHHGAQYQPGPAGPCGAFRRARLGRPLRLDQLQPGPAGTALAAEKMRSGRYPRRPRSARPWPPPSGRTRPSPVPPAVRHHRAAGWRGVRAALVRPGPGGWRAVCVLERRACQRGQILVGSTTTRSARSVMERKTTWWRPALRKAKTSTG
jgi:hypothetical protein